MNEMMNVFPNVDPIPLPAPVGLFKFLHMLTMGLHFGALHLLLGGLVLGIAWNIYAHIFKRSDAQGASDILARKMTIVTTYVINLGIPPLLFAQVLYGRALYTSSVLIAGWWFAVVLLILVSYAILYRMAHLAEHKKYWWHWGIVAFVLLAWVGRTFSTNMTLMLRPDQWLSMYQNTAAGTVLPETDPTLWPRFFLIFLGALSLGALASTLWSGIHWVSDESARFLRRNGAIISVVAAPFLIWAGIAAIANQPEVVKTGLQTSYAAALPLVWVALVVISTLASLWVAIRPQGRGLWVPALGSVFGALAIGIYTVVRDVVRDLSLARFGYDVYERVVYTNWWVVGAFLASLVGGLVFIGWLVLVVRSATPVEETHV